MIEVPTLDDSIDTVVIGDSNFKYIVDAAIDPSGCTFILASPGGQLQDKIVSKKKYPLVQKVFNGLSGNSVRQVVLNHISQQVFMDQMSDLKRNIMEIFPFAEVHMLSPLPRPDCAGLTLDSIISNLAKNPMFEKISELNGSHFGKDGVHFNNKGVVCFTKVLKSVIKN